MVFHNLRIGHLSEEKAEEKGSNKTIEGEGYDRKGKDFTIKGELDPETLNVKFTKKYKEGGV